jgi:CcmD family protein
VSELTWLFVALLAVWIGIGGYVISVGARQKRLERRIDELTRR